MPQVLVPRSRVAAAGSTTLREAFKLTVATSADDKRLTKLLRSLPS
jgi:hypothetical protein